VNENDAISFTLLKIGRRDEKPDIKPHREQYNRGNGKKRDHFAGKKIETRRRGIFEPVNRHVKKY
jgi:hypothetical protein